MKKNPQNQIISINNISKYIKKWFTLIEMLIVVIIIWIIMSIIFLIYRNMSGVILDSQRIKNISQEILYTNTYIQNISDKSDIKIDSYDKDPKDTITMIDKDSFEYKIGKECLWDQCWIYSNDKDGNNKLTNPWTTYISSLNFITIPFINPNNVNKNLDKANIKNIYSRWFWMIWEIKGKKSDPDIQSIKIQTFFGTRGY